MSEQLDGWLEAELRELEQAEGQVVTLASGKPNRIERVDGSGVLVSTGASEAKGSGPQLVPALMLNIAWRHLRSTGSLTYRHLLSPDGLNVKRSSAVCALLARLPGVEVVSSRPIELRYRARKPE
ncbi:MAG: hypothetical protein M3P85_14320 [Actinomycetota bacterium]|nr:hypothetical protein [Actinomycetota bacterium]